MRRLFFSVLVLAWTVPGAAQMPRTLVYDHVHLAAPDPAVAREWYTKYLGATPGEAPDRVAFPLWTGPRRPLPVHFVWATAASAPPSAGSVIDNIGFSFADVDAKVKEFQAAGIKVVTPVQQMPGMWKRAMVEDPWGVRIELVQDPDRLGFHHMTLRVANPEESLAWYMNTFGGERIKLEGRVDAVKYNNMYLVVLKGEGTAPSMGRAIDHISFGPTDLDSTFTELKAKGVNFTNAPSPKPSAIGHRTAMIEAPDGVRIELVMHTEAQD